MGWRNAATRRALLAAAMMVMPGVPAALANTRTPTRPERPHSCAQFTLRRNDGSGLTTLYRFSRVKALRVECNRVRQVLRDDINGCGRALGPGANWGESVDGWTVTLTSSADGYRGRAEFHAAYSVAAVG